MTDEPTTGNGDEITTLRDTVQRQEVIIDVLKQRIFELEVEVVNGRIAMASQSMQ